MPVEKDYGFETEDGTKSLAELFDGRSQLLVYHFMFGPTYEAGCPVCSSIADTHRPERPPPGGTGRDHAARLAGPAREAPGLQEADGLEHRVGLSGGSDFNRDLGFTHTEEELRPFLEGEIPPTVEQNARVLRDGRRRLRRRGTGPERVRALGRDGLPDLRDHRARPRAGDGLLRPARPDADGSRRERRSSPSGCAATTSTRPAERTTRTPRRARGPARSAGRSRRAGARRWRRARAGRRPISAEMRSPGSSAGMPGG